MLMDFKNIEGLLKKYWNCETTLEEEKQLREYFGGHNIPDQLKDTASLFRYFEEAKKKSLNDLAFDGQQALAPKPRDHDGRERRTQ